ncbi:microvirus H family protein, partial [Enterobacter bugandensis]
ENTNFPKKQHISHGIRQMLTDSHTDDIYCNKDQINARNDDISAEVGLVNKLKQHRTDGCLLYTSDANDVSNVVTDAASGVVDIFHGIDKAVADTWNNFWKDGKADGIGSNLSRK